MSIYVDTSNGVRFNGVSSVSAADILAVNGVIHKVDAVIGLPNIVTFATADPNFSTLVSALTRSDLTTDFVGVLSTDQLLHQHHLLFLHLSMMLSIDY